MALTRLLVRPPSQIRNDFLRGYRLGLIDRGVTNPNVSEGSEIFVLAEALANEISVAEGNAIIKGDATMPDTAQDDDLVSGAANWGVYQRSAVGSVGFVVFSASAASPVAAGTALIDDQGKRYSVTSAGVYADTALIPIKALDTGSSSNLAAGTVLRWVAAPPYSAPTAAVASGGLRDGYDEETLEELRARWIDVMSNPPSGGDWPALALAAERSYPSVQKAFVYPAIYGPGSVHIVVTARPTSTNKNRDLSATIVTSVVKPVVVGKFPGNADFTVTTVRNTATSLGFGMTLPSSTAASPPGPGGGWLDGTPWPQPESPATARCAVTSMGGGVYRVNASAAPTVGVSRVAAIGTDWKLYTATVASSSTVSTYVFDVTFDKPMLIVTGTFLWPQCERQDVYVQTALDAFQAMGPGEITANASALVRGTRKPLPIESWPSSVTADFTKRLQDAGDEVARATLSYPSSGISPAVPVSLADARANGPYQLVPLTFGFYPA